MLTIIIINYHDDATKLVVMPVFLHLCASRVTHTVPLESASEKSGRTPGPFALSSQHRLNKGAAGLEQWWFQGPRNQRDSGSNSAFATCQLCDLGEQLPGYRPPRTYRTRFWVKGE